MGCLLTLLEEGKPAPQPRVMGGILQKESLPLPDKPDMQVVVVTAWYIQSSMRTRNIAVFSASPRPSMPVPMTEVQWNELQRFVKTEQPPDYGFFPFKNSDYRLVARFSRSVVLVFPPLSENPKYTRDAQYAVNVAVENIGDIVVTDQCIFSSSVSEGGTLIATSLNDSSIKRWKLRLTNGPLKDDPVVNVKPVCGTRDGQLYIVTFHKNTDSCFGSYVISKFQGGTAWAEAVGKGLTYATDFAPLDGGKVVLLESGAYGVADILTRTYKKISENTGLLPAKWYVDGDALIRLDPGDQLGKFERALEYSLH